MKTERSIHKLLAHLTALTLLAFLLGVPLEQSSAGSNRAGLLIVHGNGQTLKRCVEFTESQITGLDLLTRAGLDLNEDASNAIGVAVCRIDQEGCTFPGQSCFCQCQGSPCVYWSYWRLTGGTWKYSNTGASINVLHNGDVDGWVWGAGNFSSASSPPPSITFDQICAQLTATRTPTATSLPSTNTPMPPTNTPLRIVATSVPLTNTPLPQSRTPTVGNVKPNNTLVASSNPSPTSARRAVPSPIVLAASTQTPQPTALAVVVPTQALAIEPPPDEVVEEPPAESASGSTAMLGGALHWAGMVLLGGVFCGATLAVFGLTFVVLKRLM